MEVINIDDKNTSIEKVEICNENLDEIKNKSANNKEKVDNSSIMKRPFRLEGATYKIVSPSMDHAVYVVVNKLDGVPFELFINTKSSDYFGWLTGFAKTASLILSTRNLKLINKFVDETKSISDLSGGYSNGSRIVKSVISEIGYLIGDEMKCEDVDDYKDDSSIRLFCPKCKRKSAIMNDGCLQCLDCNHSKCY